MGDTPQPRPPTAAGIPESLEELTHTTDWHGAPDRVLARMADFADSAKAGIDVTVIVAGGMISGDYRERTAVLRSNRQWFSSGSGSLWGRRKGQDR
jgi:hypothetical protein